MADKSKEALTHLRENVMTRNALMGQRLQNLHKDGLFLGDDHDTLRRLNEMASLMSQIIETKKTLADIDFLLSQ